MATRELPLFIELPSTDPAADRLVVRNSRLVNGAFALIFFAWFCLSAVVILTEPFEWWFPLGLVAGALGTYYMLSLVLGRGPMLVADGAGLHVAGTRVPWDEVASIEHEVIPGGTPREQNLWIEVTDPDALTRRWPDGEVPLGRRRELAKRSRIQLGLLGLDMRPRRVFEEVADRLRAAQPDAELERKESLLSVIVSVRHPSAAAR